MAEDILKYQAGREAAIRGDKRDARKSSDWLEGYDAARAVKEASYALPSDYTAGRE